MEYQNIDYLNQRLLERFELDAESYKSNPKLPTWHGVVRELQKVKENNSIYGAFKDMLVFPKVEKDGESFKPVLFTQDVWKPKWAAGCRAISFEGLPPTLKFESKLLCLAELWLLDREAKLHHLTRKGQNIVLVAKKCAELHMLSLKHLGSDSNRDKLYWAFREESSHDSTRNKFIDMRGLADLEKTPFKDYGLYISTDPMDGISKREDGNQTYAMPFSIMVQVWQGHRNYAINIRKEYLRYALPIVRMISKFNLKTPDCGKDITHVNTNMEFLEYLAQPKFQRLLRIYHKKFPNDKAVIHRDTLRTPGNKFREKRITNIGIVYSTNLATLAKHINEVSNILLLGIQTYTGMRESESKDVTCGSLVVDDEAGYIGVDSNLYKFAPEGGFEDIWAAAPWVEECFITARMIAKALFADHPEHDIDNTTILPNIATWLSRSVLEKRKGRANREFVTPPPLAFAQKYNIKITDDCVHEFFKLNRNINNIDKVKNDIKVGEYWPIRSHQFRRTIAVHSKRLGAASDRALSFQLKHRLRSQTDWYTDGGVANSALNSKAAERLYKLWKEEEDTAMAETSVELQESKNLFGRGGELLKSGQGKSDKAKVYPSIKKAKQMAARGKSKLKALGHGMYCLQGDSCSMRAVMQNANCDNECENLVADDDAISYHRTRFDYYENLLDNSIPHSRTDAQIEYIRLEMESHREFLEYFGVANNV